MRKVACGLQPSTTTARAGQANTGGIRGKVRSICGAKVDATDGNDGKHTKGGIDYDRPNLIRGGSAVGYRSISLKPILPRLWFHGNQEVSALQATLENPSSSDWT